MTYDADLRLAEARAALEASSLPADCWALGEFQDDRPCLILDEALWIAGYFERGNFEVKYTEVDTGVAVSRFVAWVQSITDSTAASAAATEEWLRRMGKERP